MRKLGLAGLAATWLILLTAIPASAGSELQPPDVAGVVVDTDVAGVVVDPLGAPAGTIAFTGGSVRVWMVLAVGLLMVGVALLIAGRRRRANAAP